MACGTIRKAFALGLLALVFVAPATSGADPLRTAVTVDVSAAYARLVFALSEDIDASAHAAGNVLIINFAKPVFLSVESLSMQAPNYIGAARRDPDGRAIRLALARKVTVNSMAAGAKFFVDLLPETWSGAPHGLPQEVVEELARRAREAERLARLAQQSEQQKKLVPVRVHVATQPTFTRYVFDIPDQTAVSADRASERLTLTFDAPLTFDLTDVEAALPAAVVAINSEVEQDSALVRFSFLTKVDVRTFRDGKGYVVDVVNADAAAAAHDKAAGNGLPILAAEGGLSAKLLPEAVAPSAAAAPTADLPGVAAPATVAVQTPAVPQAAAAPIPRETPKPAEVKTAPRRPPPLFDPPRLRPRRHVDEQSQILLPDVLLHKAAQRSRGPVERFVDVDLVGDQRLDADVIDAREHRPHHEGGEEQRQRDDHRIGRRGRGAERGAQERQHHDDARERGHHHQDRRRQRKHRQQRDQLDNALSFSPPVAAP
jgi:hypothetical protein